MIVVRNGSEKKLYKALSLNETKNDNHRCVYLKVSGLSKTILEDVIKFIYNNIDNQDSSVFICDDGDIFIIGDFIGRAFTDVLEEFIHSLAPTSGFGPDFGLTVLFEIRIERYRILKIIEEKLDVIAKKDILADKVGRATKKEKKEKEETNRQKIMNISIPQDLIESLSKRREGRKEIEILVVEDEAFSRTIVEKSLSDFGNVSVAVNGRDAINRYFTKAPHILFLDIGLPDIDGHDVLTKILEHDPQAFIIMLSGKGDKNNILKAIENGAKGFVGKPFTREKLSQYIQKSPHV